MTDFQLAEHALRMARDHHGGAANSEEVVETARRFLAFLKETVTTEPEAAPAP